MGLIGPYLPACRPHLEPVPDFSHFVKVQENLYDSMMTQSAEPMNVLALKRFELATRDLQVMVKLSTLKEAKLLESKLGEYIDRSRLFGKDILSLQAQTRGVLDNLITYNTFTLNKLSDVESKKASRQELRIIYEHAMALFEKEATRLIVATVKAQQSLDELEEDLRSIHEIALQETSYQVSEKPHLLADLVNMVQGKGLRRPLVEQNLKILRDFDSERMKAAQRLMIMLDKMDTLQMDLEELRSQVVVPVVAPDVIPLEIHIENVGKAIERLKAGKIAAWEERSGRSHSVESLPLSSAE
ncbi:hypothetical protein EC973_006824 [Apophysomyces ossiformis]|uniref:Uncharacterized protein n=1 Tax=Apophysomyces ossiformis TaxID=679940 RepID=A0A8H7EQ67_9FUNG|nr:hypothetical protein EC973_006824 [Apophysomyces ossiformis]